jgi:hypothetical protein
MAFAKRKSGEQILFVTRLRPCFVRLSHSDGTQLIVAVGVRVLVYDANDGDLMHSLKGA